MTYWRFLDVEGLPPVGERVVASDGCNFWLDVRSSDPRLEAISPFGRWCAGTEERRATMWFAPPELPR